MTYLKVTANAVGDSFEIFEIKRNNRNATVRTMTSTTYRPFRIESVDMIGGMGVYQEDKKKFKHDLEGSVVLAYLENADDSALLTPGQKFALMEGVKEKDGNFQTLVLRGTIYDCDKDIYKLMKVDDVGIMEKRADAPQVASIDYDETIEFGRKKTGPEYTGDGADFGV